MRDKFCAEFGLRKKSAFIKFSKNSINLVCKKICKQAGKFNEKQAQIYRSYQKDSRLPA